MRSRTLELAMTIFLMTAASGGPAAARPTVGATPPPARVTAQGGQVLETGALRGQVVVIFYEDKDSRHLNMALRAALVAQRQAGARRPDARVFGVADVSSYDYWPASKYVKKAIRDEERRSGEPIYLDWEGGFRRALGLERGTSHVLVLDADGRVLVSHAGPVPAAVQAQILQATSS